jgi:hypothetical protein
VGWDANSIIALVGVIVAPAAALAGAWVNSYLARKEKAVAQAEASRRDVARAAGPMFGILVDAIPDLIRSNELREYDTPEEAVAGLYRRWTKAREPLLVLSFGHPSELVRKLAFALQAEVEMSLRFTERDLAAGEPKAYSHSTGDITAADFYRKAQTTATELAEEITRITVV